MRAASTVLLIGSLAAGAATAEDGGPRYTVAAPSPAMVPVGGERFAVSARVAAPADRATRASGRYAGSATKAAAAACGPRPDRVFSHGFEDS